VQSSDHDVAALRDESSSSADDGRVAVDAAATANAHGCGDAWDLAPSQDKAPELACTEEMVPGLSRAAGGDAEGAKGEVFGAPGKRAADEEHGDAADRGPPARHAPGTPSSRMPPSAATSGSRESYAARGEHRH
jgi:hypothetical protein